MTVIGATLPERERKAVLHAVMAAAGPGAVLVRHAERVWASATFSGIRATTEMEFIGERACEAGEAFIADLPFADWAVPGVLVADALVTCLTQVAGDNPRLAVTVELLVLNDGCAA